MDTVYGIMPHTFDLEIAMDTLHNQSLHAALKRGDMFELAILFLIVCVIASIILATVKKDKWK